MTIRNNLTDKKFNRLLVIEPCLPRNIGRHLYYKCLCDCGKETIVDGTKLRNNHTKSCGCLHEDIPKDHNKLEKGIANRNALLGSYKRNAKHKNLPFSLTDEEVISIFESNCYYCGKVPYCVFERKNTNGPYIFTGIDRLDSSLGYTKENTVPCCSKCNYIKSDMSYKEFLEWIENVHTNLKQGIHFCQGMENQMELGIR